MDRQSHSRWLPSFFTLTLFFSALTGFAQMPIFKRYYIADIPGMGWLAQFYVTYALHYISACLVITMVVYWFVDYLLLQRRRLRVSLYGLIRGGLLLMILVTGIMLVLRNLPGYRFSPEFVVVLDFAHLGLVVVFLMVGLVGRMMGKRWIRALVRDS